jgi:hypothetical protein
MTLSSTTSRAAYAGNGSTTEFSVPFLFADNSHIAVTLRQAGGAELAWAETTHYSLSGAGEPSGGTLTALDAPLGGQTLVIRRVVPLTQETDYVENDPFPAEAHEQALDLAAMRDQQLQEQLDRTLRFPITDTSPLPELPSFASRANKLLGFDSSGDPTLAAAPSDLSPVTAEGTTAARGLAERFGEIVTPRDFGAVGDGVADDTAALLACLKDGRPVRLEAGMIYKITDELDLRGYAGRKIVGAGAAANPANPGGFAGSQPSVIRQATSNKPILRLSGSHHTIDGIYLDYATQQTTSDSAAVAVELNNVSHSRFSDLRIFQANTSIGIPQIAYGTTSHNVIFDCILDGIDSNEASECHIDLRNYNGGGTNTTLRNVYINGGGSLDFVTAGQSANYAMRFSNWSGLEIGAVSIDGQILNSQGISFHNCTYVIHTLRFEAATLKPNTAVWIDHIGGYCSGKINFVELLNCKWSPAVPGAMYVLQANCTVIKLLVEKVRVGSNCVFDLTGFRRVLINSGVGVAGTGYVNDIRIRDIEDQNGKLSDLAWTDTNGTFGPYNVREWRGGYPQLLLRSGFASTSARIIGGSGTPTTGNWLVGDMVINVTPADVGRPWAWQCTTAGSPGVWMPCAFNAADGGGATSWGDADATLFPLVSRKTNYWITALTADRTITLSTTAVYSGCTFRIARPASGAFNLSVGSGPLKALAAGTWCEVVYDSFQWRLAAYGAL